MRGEGEGRERGGRGEGEGRERGGEEGSEYLYTVEHIRLAALSCLRGRVDLLLCDVRVSNVVPVVGQGMRGDGRGSDGRGWEGMGGDGRGWERRWRGDGEEWVREGTYLYVTSLVSMYVKRE